MVQPTMPAPMTMTDGEDTLTEYDGRALLVGEELPDGEAPLDGIEPAAPSSRATPSRSAAPTRSGHPGENQNPKDAPISIRRAGPAEVGVPKNDDCWLPMKAL